MRQKCASWKQATLPAVHASFIKKMRKNRRKPLWRRLIRWILTIALIAALYSGVGGYIPFARCLKIDDLSALEARAAEMDQDVATGDRAAILETRTEALDVRIRLMAQAKREIVIATYDTRDGEVASDILAVAMWKAREGVRVRLLVDGIAGRLNLMPSELFRAAAGLPNVEIRFYNCLSQLTPWKHMGRMHDKYLIVDDAAYILGGRNMFDSFIGEYPAPVYSVDREALVYNSDGSADSSVFALRAYFEGMWEHAETTVFEGGGIGEQRRREMIDGLSERCARMRADKPQLFEPADYSAMTDETRGVWLVSNPTMIYAKRPVVFEQLCALMRRAERDVVIHSPYAVLNGHMRSALADIAARVPVTLMINAVENGANVVASSDYLYHRSDLLDTGVHLLEYAGGESYHGKALAIDDDLSVIGSFNLDLRSTYVDTELMLVIRGEAVNAKLRGHMDALHAKCRDAASGDVPDGLSIPEMPLWKRAALRALGALLQPFRNMV